WLNSAQQILALQQFHQMQESGAVLPLPLGASMPPPEMFNLSAANIAHVYQNMHNGPTANSDYHNTDEGDEQKDKLSVKEEEQEEPKSLDESKEPESNQGMSRRALRFKSHKRKPVQIRQQDSDEDENETKNVKHDEPKDSDDESGNELEIDA